MTAEGVRRRGRRAATGLPRLPWRSIVNPFRPVEILSADQVESIHRASLRILREIGVEVLGERALDVFEQAGAAGRPGATERPARRWTRRIGDRARAARVRAPRPEPGARRDPGRRPPRVRSGRRAGLRDRPRPWTATGQLRRLLRLRPGHRGARHRPAGGWWAARADRPAGRDASSRHVPRARDPPRQDVAEPRRRAGAGRRCDRGRVSHPWDRSRRAASVARAS